MRSQNFSQRQIAEALKVSRDTVRKVYKAADENNICWSMIQNQNEMEVQKAIDTLIKGRTVIVIAHRLKTIKDADQIIVLDNGMIKEQGTHDELVRKKGLYSHLWEIQDSISGWKL